MYSIGELSKIVKISIDSLRYYDEIDLLKPHHIDQNSRYRYYSEEQISDILFIMELKQYGFSLDAIKQLIMCNDVDKIKDALNSRILELSKESVKIQKSIDLIKRRLKEIENKGDYNMDNIKILLVDDSKFIRNVLVEYFTNRGFDIVGEASNGLEAFEKYFEVKPDVVIMNVEMPVQNGIEAVKCIKEKDSNAKFVMCSAKGYIPTILESIKAGADNFIVKPFQPESLKEAIIKVSEEVIEYNKNTVDCIINDNRFKEIFEKGPLSQNAINKLLSVCIKEYAEEIYEEFEFLI